MSMLRCGHWHAIGCGPHQVPACISVYVGLLYDPSLCLSQVYLTYQTTASAGDESRDVATPPRSDADAWLLAIVERVLAGQDTGDEQSSVSFDRALATGGAHPTCFMTPCTALQRVTIALT